MAKDLRRLLAAKDNAHYGLSVVSAGEAQRLVGYAKRILGHAQAVLET